MTIQDQRREDTDVRRLARRLRALPDPAVRVGFCRAWVREHEPLVVAEIVLLAAHRAEAREASHASLLLALCLALADAPEVRAAVVQAAVASGRLHAATLLTPKPPFRRSEDPVPVPDFGGGRALTLGERKSMARRRDRDLLARVLRDPHPDVVRILLGNPTMVEADLVRLCARRPLDEAIFREVFRSPRWVFRYPVRRAMVNNPYCPVDLALQLAPALTLPDARKVRRAVELAPALRDTCDRIAGAFTKH
jgi:hypothetical protein